MPEWVPHNTYPCQLGGLVPLTQLALPVILFLLQVGVFLNLGLVESVDDGVLPLTHKDPLDLAEESEKEVSMSNGGGMVNLFVVVERHLADCHAAVFLEV